MTEPKKKPPWKKRVYVVDKSPTKRKITRHVLVHNVGSHWWINGCRTEVEIVEGDLWKDSGRVGTRISYSKVKFITIAAHSVAYTSEMIGTTMEIPNRMLYPRFQGRRPSPTE